MLRITTAAAVRIFLAHLALVAVAYSFISTAHADQPKTFSWSWPTQLQDGTTITPADLERFDIRCSRTSGAPYERVFDADVVDLPEPTAVVSMAPGDWYCIARASNSVGWSGFSNEVFFSIVESPPNAPTNLTIGD